MVHLATKPSRAEQNLYFRKTTRPLLVVGMTEHGVGEPVNATHICSLMSCRRKISEMGQIFPPVVHTPRHNKPVCAADRWREDPVREGGENPPICKGSFCAGRTTPRGFTPQTAVVASLNLFRACSRKRKQLSQLLRVPPAKEKPSTVLVSYDRHCEEGSIAGKGRVHPSLKIAAASHAKLFPSLTRSSTPSLFGGFAG